MYMYFLSLFLVPAFATPFWKAKDKFHTRIQNGEVLVSVHEESREAHRLNIEGGAQVKATKDFTVQTTRDYERIARLTGYVDEAQYDASSGILKAKLAAYGYHAKMDIKMQNLDDGISFEVVEGTLKGLQMQIHVESVTPNVSEVGMDGTYAYEKFPLPRFFLEFGMEVIFKRMAWRLRQQVESDFKRKAA